MKMFKPIIFTLTASALLITGCVKNSPSKGSMETRQNAPIVGGEKLEEMTDGRSSTVLIFISDKTTVIGTCTGTLIAQDIVLTAAHCTPPEGGTALIGFGNNMDESFSKPKYAPVLATRSITHPLYKSPEKATNSAYDIALMKLTAPKPDTFTTRALPAQDFVIPETAELLMIGFGYTSEELADAGTLYQTTLSASHIASSIYNDEHKFDLKLPGNIAILQPQTGVCQCDSGGPLYIRGKDGSITLVGVTSKLVNFEDHKRFCHGFSIFTDVRVKLSWIQETMAELSK